VVLASSGLIIRQLPRRYWTIGLESTYVWDGKDVKDILGPPQDIVLHHGNYTVGVARKKALLDEVKRRVYLRKR
jgi:hypothetical protein